MFRSRLQEDSPEAEDVTAALSGHDVSRCSAVLVRPTADGVRDPAMLFELYCHERLLQATSDGPLRTSNECMPHVRQLPDSRAALVITDPGGMTLSTFTQRFSRSSSRSACGRLLFALLMFCVRLLTPQ
jgi:hypothetical protein